MKPHNSARITSNVWWGLAAASVFIIFLPGLIGMDGFNGGFAISFLAFFFVIISVIVAVIYMRQAAVLARIFSGQDLLAHWTYQKDEWSEYTEKENVREKVGKTRLFILVSGIALVVGIIFVLVTHDSGGVWVMASIITLIAILAFTAWFTSWYDYRQNRKNLGEAYITPKAVYLNKRLYTWGNLGSWLESVNIQDSTPPYIEFKYVAAAHAIVQEYTVNVPVPHGKEQEARDLIDRFSVGKSTGAS